MKETKDIRLRAILLGVIVFALLTFHLYTATQVGPAASILFGLIIASLTAYISLIVSKLHIERRKREQAEARVKVYRHELNLTREMVTDQTDEILKLASLISAIDLKTSKKLFEICDDVVIFLEKMEEKNPQSRIKDTKLVKVLLGYVLDILPQYIEKNDRSKFFESPFEKMKEGEDAIETLSGYLHRNIAALETSDEMRYDVAVAMLKALKDVRATKKEPQVRQASKPINPTKGRN